MASQILPPTHTSGCCWGNNGTKANYYPSKDLEPKSNFLKWFSQKNMKMLFYKADLPAFHTHFVDFGGVGIDEKGRKHQIKQITFQIAWFFTMLNLENYDFHTI